MMSLYIHATEYLVVQFLYSHLLYSQHMNNKTHYCGHKLVKKCPFYK